MIDILNKHLSTEDEGCTVQQWVESLTQEEKEAFALVKQNNKNIKLASLFSDLSKEDNLPFKLTAFRSHFRGYCTCQN